METVLVTIVVPVYKIPEALLRKCVESLLAQSMREIEIIFVDDGSPDNCGTVCEEYAKVDARVKVFRQKNAGVSVARNFGMQKACGEYITFVDADDWCDERMCETAYNYAKENGSDVVFCSAYRASQMGEKIHLWENEKKLLSENERKKLVETAVLPKIFSDGVKNAAWGKFYKTNVVRGTFEYTPNVSYGQDNIFNLKIFMSSLRFSYCPESCYYYQDQNPMQTMSRFNPRKMEEVKTLVAELRQAVLVAGEKKYEKELNARKIAMILVNVLPQQFFHPDNKDGLIAKYLKLRNFVVDENLQKDLRGDFDDDNFPIVQKIVIWICKNKLWFLLIFVEIKWFFQRKMGMWK